MSYSQHSSHQLNGKNILNIFLNRTLFSTQGSKPLLYQVNEMFKRSTRNIRNLRKMLQKTSFVHNSYYKREKENLQSMQV